MKIIQKILVGIGVFLIFFVGVGFLLPAQVVVQRELLIHATPEQIQPWLENLKQWNEWLPWSREMDPSIVYQFSGAERGVGAQMEWVADKMGQGILKLTESDPQKGITYTINFNYDSMLSEGILNYQPTSDGTVVIWRDQMKLGNNPINRYLGLLMDAMLGADFDKGLAKLKFLVESKKT